MKRVTLMVLVVGPLLIGAAVGYRWYRYYQLRDHPLPGFPGRYGIFLDSPNRRFQLDASNLADESFWGKRRSYYRFSVFDLSANGKTVRRFDMETMSGDPIVRLARDGAVEWALDSSAVTISFGSTELKIHVDDL
jgi:hypothetical protein